MTQPFNNFVDNLELAELRQIVQAGRVQEALPRLYKLASIYPNNQELKDVIVGALGPVAQTVSSQAEPVVKAKSTFVIWAAISSVVVILLGIAILIVVVAWSKPGIEAYREYYDTQTLVYQAVVGERVRFPAFNPIVASNLLGTPQPVEVQRILNNNKVLEYNSTRTIDHNTVYISVNIASYGNIPDSLHFDVLGRVTSRVANHLYVDAENFISTNSGCFMSHC